MKWNRTISLLLCLAMLMGMLSGCGGNTTGDKPIGDDSIPENAVTLDAELQRALDAGLLPEEWLSDLNATVTVAELNKQLTKIIEMRNPALVSEWESLAEYALLHEETAQRDDALVSIYEAAMLMGIENTRRSYANEDWEAKSPAEDWWEGHTMDYDYFPNWGAVSADANSVWYAQAHVSLVNQETFFPPTEQWTMGLGLDVTREDAARALIRFMESDPSITYGESKYISVNDAGAYDRNIITDELLSANTTLPEVTQSKLPSEWQGAGISARKSYTDCYLHFEESDVRVLAENGFNFARLFLGFSTLRYPDFPEDARMINEKELEELDQLLAWCMEYGVHLQIAMSFYLDENGDAKEEMPSNDAEWALVKDYWEAIARRYAGIPSKYLSFDLCNEICPQNDEQVAFAKDGFVSLVNAVRAADEERVLLHSFSGYSNEAWAEVLGTLKIAIGCHPYRPHSYCDGTYPESEFLESNLYWPRPRFNSIVSYGNEVTITGEGLTGTLSIYPQSSDPDAVMRVYADKQMIAEFDLPAEGTRNEHGGYDFSNNEAFSVGIPDGTEKISIQTMANAIYLNAVGIKNDDFHTWLMCHDAYESEDEGTSNLTIDAAGVWQNADGLMSDAEYVYEQHILPLIEIAEKYDVGFMVNEFGLFGVKVYWDINEVTKYHDEFLKMLEAHDIGWCYCELANLFPKHLVILWGNESQWTGATVEEITYTFDDGSSKTLRICKELMDTFTQYTK